MGLQEVTGMSALATVIYLGSRKVRYKPHSTPLIAIGMAIMWFAWFGFTAGNAFSSPGSGKMQIAAQLPEKGMSVNAST
jgi:Amt family ammonium transporter